ncbi:MAG TPA: L-threonylcarbamoyladenylate synthase [Longilinea sp.]|nr:L-threonylcarbamoyladenylate synthase [Longilinea sp.]
MSTPVIKTTDPKALAAGQRVLQAGGVLVFPTDTVYGLGCLVNLGTTIDRLFEIKGRDTNKAIAVLIGNIDHLTRVTAGLGETARRLADIFWPGALTLVVPRSSQLPANLSPLPTIGVRMPDHAFTQALLQSTGPLATTSANLSGLSSPITAQDVLDQLKDRVDLVLDGGACPGGVPSTVVDCTGTELRILREGAITRGMLEQVVGRKF